MVLFRAIKAKSKRVVPATNLFIGDGFDGRFGRPVLQLDGVFGRVVGEVVAAGGGGGRGGVDDDAVLDGAQRRRLVLEDGLDFVLLVRLLLLLLQRRGDGLVGKMRSL